MNSRLLNFVFLTAIVVMGVFLLKGCRENAELGDLFAKKSDTAKYFKDKYGKEHARLESTETSYGNILVLHAHEIDSLSSLLGVAKNHIKSSTTIISKTAFDVQAPVTYDTTGVAAHKQSNDHQLATWSVPLQQWQQVTSLNAVYVDDWFHLNIKVDGATAYARGYVQDTTGVVKYTKGLFFPKTYIDVVHRSPYVKTNDIKQFEVTDGVGRLSVVLFAGAGYNVSSVDLKRPVAIFGAGLGYRLFSIGKK